MNEAGTMRHTLRVALLGLTVGLAACTNAGRFGEGGGFGGAGSGAGASAAAPDTPAYFQEVVGDRVFFAVDDATLSDEARATLDAQARWLTENPDYVAVIEGHADERGTREYNLALGARRANAVKEYLVARGVAPGRLSTVSYGKERPVALCSAESCYAQNRRAVTVLTGGLSG